MFLRLKKKISAFLIGLSLVVVVFVVIPFEQAKAIPLGLPFGGWIGWVTYCTCSFNLLLTVVGPSPGNFVLQPGVSIIFPFGQVYRPGPAVVGSYTPGGACMVFSGKGCAPEPVTGTIIMIGTSL